MANESRKNIKNERNFFAWWRSRISEFRVKWNLFMNYSNVVDDIITEHTERKAMEKFHFPCSNFHPRCATFTFKLDASGGLLMRFSTFHRSTNTLWQFNYNISLFQLVPIDFFSWLPFFSTFFPSQSHSRAPSVWCCAVHVYNTPRLLARSPTGDSRRFTYLQREREKE